MSEHPAPGPRRRRRTLPWVVGGIVVVALAVVGVVVGTSMYSSAENAKASAAPSVAASRAPSTLDDDLAGDWTIGDGSEAGYRVHEVLNGNDVTVTGRTDSVSGTASVDGTSITAARIEVQVADIATDSSQRDSYFRDSALDTSAFPTATFTLDRPIADAVPSGSGTTTVEATGTLTLHGVTKTVTATLQVGLDGDGVDVSGTIPITFSDYGVQAPSLGFVTVDDAGAVEFEVHATPAS